MAVEPDIVAAGRFRLGADQRDRRAAFQFLRRKTPPGGKVLVYQQCPVPRDADTVETVRGIGKRFAETFPVFFQVAVVPLRDRRTVGIFPPRKTAVFVEFDIQRLPVDEQQVAAEIGESFVDRVLHRIDQRQRRNDRKDADGYADEGQPGTNPVGLQFPEDLYPKIVHGYKPIFFFKSRRASKASSGDILLISIRARESLMSSSNGSSSW